MGLNCDFGSSSTAKRGEGEKIVEDSGGVDGGGGG